MDVGQIDKSADPEEKIAVFRSLFQGREDVFARRFESRRTGKSGYAPACANEWVRGVCEKPRIKCAHCPHRQFFPVTDEVIRQHLLGWDTDQKPFVMGVYPLFVDESCVFLALDLDKKNWRLDAMALMDTCERLHIPAAVERSRSGEGAHLWIFFSEPVPAILARKLGAHLLTETMEHRPDIGFDSYDRMFPNQDTMPSGGFGNLIALPLQAVARKNGNSLFLQPDLTPHVDQWLHLSGLKRMSLEEVQSVVRTAADKGRILGVRAVPEDDFASTPWLAPPSRKGRQHIQGPLPANLSLTLNDQIYLTKEELPPALRNLLLRLAAFQNPEFYKAQAMRLPTYSKPRIIACAEEFPEHIALPRGCLDEIKSVLGELNIKTRILDKRIKGNPVDLTFQGELRADQQQAFEKLRRHETRVLAATTAFGKTVLAAALIAERGVNTLIFVHRKQLMDQWVERLTEFLNIEAKEIGCLGGGRRKLKGIVDIALLQSVVRKGVVDDRVAEYGQVIVDECHHVSAQNFELAVRRTKARFVLGLSATVTRKDGHHPVIFMQCGPVRYQVRAKGHEGTQSLSKQVIVRPTEFQPSIPEDPDARMAYTGLMTELIRDEKRNLQILDDVCLTLGQKAHPLVLTERSEHLDWFADALRKRDIEVVILQGGMNKGDLKYAILQTQDRNEEHPLVLLATGRFVGEGFDDAALDTLFLTMPVSWKGIVAQYAGRLHRLRKGKTAVRIYDYADLQVPMLSRMFDKRCRGYESLGYTILLPASAIPGWPVQVPLPVNPDWKRTYAASVHRLVRDGVDIPLAELFLQASCSRIGSDKKGADRARSASEAFLYRRLQGLDETKNRFQLNQQIPVPFRGRSEMEVDFLDLEAKWVLELDGAAHFADAEAYRRDREKDLLLQQNGYLVMRFLAEDLTANLQTVLDTILRGPVRQ